MPIVLLGTIEQNEVLDETFCFDYPGSDIVLRSSDSHNFRLPKLYIVICSPVLRVLIQSISKSSDGPNGEKQELLLVVQLPEIKTTLYSLLTFIFPVIPILPPTAEKIMELLAVAQRYQMDSVVSHIRGAISRQSPPFIRPETALYVYFLAQHHELHQEAVQAARVTLRSPMIIEGLEDKLDFPDFPGMTGAYLHELWRYHERARTNLKSSVSVFRSSGLPYEVKNLQCIGPRTGAYGGIFPQWLSDYIHSIAGAPHLFDRIEFEYARACHIQTQVYSSSSTCSCANFPIQVIRTFWDALTAVFHRAIGAVC